MSKKVTEAETDPFAALEMEALKQQLEIDFKNYVSRARARLVLDKNRPDAPFWSVLAMRLKVVLRWDIDTMATDGKHLFGNPAFLKWMTEQERVGVIAHECAHNAFKHHCRRGHRNPRKWNIAADLAINPVLLGGGFKLPQRPGCQALIPGEGPFADLPPLLSAERYYDLLTDEMMEGFNDSDDPGGLGRVVDAGDGSEAAQAEAEAEADVAVRQAQNVAKQRGTMSANLQRIIGELLEPKVDWKNELREFVSVRARNDYCWARPNRRFVAEGIYLPGMESEELGELVFAVDTSGSIDGPTLNRFASEMAAVISAFAGVTLVILYHDSAVCHVQTWEPSDGDLILEPKGGGGTDHKPVFAWIEEHKPDGITALICLTDLYSDFPATEPEYPVLWASTTKADGPFGRTLYIGDAT